MRFQAGRMRLQAGRMRLRANLVGLEHVALLAQLDALVVEAALEVVGARVERHVGGTTTGLGRSLGHLVLRSLQRDEARREPLQDEVVPPPGRRRAEALPLRRGEHLPLLEPQQALLGLQHSECLLVAHVRPKHDLQQPELGSSPLERAPRRRRVLAGCRVARRVRGLQHEGW